jgi:hypothetical protein
VQLSGGLPENGLTIGRISLATDHTPGSTMVFAAESQPIGVNGRAGLANVYRSTDNGNTWAPVNPPDFTDNFAWFTLAIGLAPNGRVYLGGAFDRRNNPPDFGVYESNLGGTDWLPVDLGTNLVNGVPLEPHSDFHAFAFGPDGAVYAGTDGGLWRLNPLPLDMPKSYSIPQNPAAIATGNYVAGQGPPLLAVAYSNQVRVLQSNGKGSFNFQADYPVGGTAAAIAASDFDGNGVLDLAVANNGPNPTVSVLLGTNDGTNVLFRRAADVPIIPIFGQNTGVVVTSVAAADFNGDGNVDFVVAVYSPVDPTQGAVEIELGNGDGTFRYAGFIRVGSRPTALAVGDFNGDGLPDLVVANRDDNTVSVLLGTQPGGNWTLVPTTFATGAQPSAVAVGDFDDDGTLDVAVANQGGNSVSVLRGDGQGGFLPAVNVAVASAPFGLGVGDFNGDGVVDLAVSLSDRVQVLNSLNPNGDLFLPPLNYPAFPTQSGLVVGEFNGDGRPDLAVLASNLPVVNVFLSNAKVPEYGRNTWLDLNTPGLQTHLASSVAVNPQVADYLLVASQDNGLAQSSDGAQTWTSVLGGDGMMVRFDAGGGIAYALLQKGVFYRSNDIGATWRPKPVGQDRFPFRSVMALDPGDPRRLVVGSNTTVYETYNRGDPQVLGDQNLPAWSPISPLANNNPLDRSGVTALAYGPSLSGRGNLVWGRVLYAGFTDGRVFLTTDDPANGNLAHWLEMSNPWGANRTVSSLVTDPQRPNYAYAGIAAFGAGQVFRTTNGGGAWENISGNLPNVPVNALVLDNNCDCDPPVLYAGTDVGVFQGMFVGGNWTWRRLGDGGAGRLPNVQVRDLQLQGRTLLAATYGRGVWRIPLPQVAGRAGAIQPQEGVAWTGVLATISGVPAGAGPGDYSARIDWGDNSTSAGTIVPNASGGFDVVGTHTYEEGEYEIQVIVRDPQGDAAQTCASATVPDAALDLVSVNPVQTTENQEFDLVLMTFHDEDPLGEADDYYAWIDFGDGNYGEGIIDGDGNGNFTVEADHTYGEEGSYTITIYLLDWGGSELTVTDDATVADAPLSSQDGDPIQVYEGRGVYVSVPFADANPGGEPGDYFATIDYGDGNSQSGTVSGMTVTGYHNYGPEAEGDFTITVTVRDVGGSTTTAHIPVEIVEAPVSGTGAPVQAVEGAPFYGVMVAAFAEPDGWTGDNYTAVIHWGDGATSGGVVSPAGTGFQVHGSHTYLEEGGYTIQTDIYDDGQLVLTVTGGATVADAGLQGLSIAYTGASVGVPLNVTAYFSDSDPNGTVEDYSAVIHWGDGASTPGVVGVGQVSGSHVYGVAGTYRVQVVISDVGGSTLEMDIWVTVYDNP